MAEGIRKLHSKGCPRQDGEALPLQRRLGGVGLLGTRREEGPQDLRAGGGGEVLARGSEAGARPRRPAPQRPRRPHPCRGAREFVAGMQAGASARKGRERYKPNTIRSYERALRVHIEPLGGRADQGRRGASPRPHRASPTSCSRDGLSARTVSNVLNPIQAFYRWAIDRDELAYNPSERIDLPERASPSARSGSPLQQEAAALLAALDAEDRPLWATAFYAGLRRGELQALRACDVDLGASLIARRARLGSGRGRDRAEVTRRAAQGAAAGDPARLPGRAPAAGPAGAGKTSFSAARPTQAFYASTVDGRAKRAWEAANEREREAAEGEGRMPVLLDPITLHQCRHTFASLLIDSGANPKAIQEFMGHSKIQTTFDVYGHLLPGSHDEVRERMDAYLLDRTSDAGSADPARPTPPTTSLRSDWRNELAHAPTAGERTGALDVAASAPRIRLSKAPHNRKRPAGEAGRFWGYYREERYVSLYMWIRGR